MERRRNDRNNSSSLDQYVLDLRDLVIHIWEKRFLFAILFLVPVALGAIHLMAKPDIYGATSTVLLENQEVNLTDIQEAFPGVEFDERTVDTQAKVLTSSTLIHHVIQRLGMHIDADGSLTITRGEDGQPVSAADTGTTESGTSTEDPNLRYNMLKQYMASLNVQPVQSSRIIEISFRSEDPFVAAEVANAHAKEYVESEVRNRREQAERLNSWISEEIKKLREQNAEKAAEIAKYREETGMIEGRNSEDLIFQQISDIAAQLVNVEGRKAELQARGQGIDTSDTTSTVGEVMSSPVIQGLKAQATTARQELQSLSATYGPNHPMRKEAQRRVNLIESDIAREIANIKQSVGSELETIIDQEARLNALLTELKAKADTLRQNQITLKALEFEEDASSKLLDNYLARYEEVSSLLDFARADVRIVSLADVPMDPIGTKKPLMMVVIAFLSLVFATAVVFVLSLIDRGVKTGDDVRKHLGIRLLGVLPKVRNVLQEAASGGRSIYVEEIKRICLHITGRENVKAVLVTSATEAEGKTTTALALAAYLVSAGRRAVVVDADFISSGLATMADVGAAPGLADVIAGSATIESVVKYDARGVGIVPGGTARGAAENATLSSPVFKTAIEQLKTRFDYVFIDTPAMLSSTDAEIVARTADLPVMVVSAGKVSKKDLKKAAETLRQFSREIPSVILNKASTERAV